MTASQRYQALPEWLRWIVCWPISAGAALACSLLLFVLMVGRVPVLVHYVLGAAVGQVTFLETLFLTVPRARIRIVFGAILLRAVMLVLFVAQALVGMLAYFGFFDGMSNLLAQFDDVWVREFIGEIVVLCVSVATYLELRGKQSSIGVTTSEPEPRALLGIDR
jgi:hypothetical protein